MAESRGFEPQAITLTLLSRQAQSPRLDYSLKLEEGGGIEPLTFPLPRGSNPIAGHSAAPSKVGTGGGTRTHKSRFLRPSAMPIRLLPHGGYGRNRTYKALRNRFTICSRSIRVYTSKNGASGWSRTSNPRVLSTLPIPI